MAVFRVTYNLAKALNMIDRRYSGGSGKRRGGIGVVAWPYNYKRGPWTEALGAQGVWGSDGIYLRPSYFGLD